MRHVAVLKYKPGTAFAHIEEITSAFRALQHVTPGIFSFGQGVKLSKEDPDQGFHQVFLVTSQSAEAHDAYLPHPAHTAFSALLKRLGIVGACSWSITHL